MTDAYEIGASRCGGGSPENLGQDVARQGGAGPKGCWSVPKEQRYPIRPTTPTSP